MMQGVHDISPAGGENTGEIQSAVFYLAEKRSLAMEELWCHQGCTFCLGEIML